MQQKVGELLKSVYCERRWAFGMVGAGCGQEHRGVGPGPGRACGTSRNKCPLNVLTFSRKWESGHQPGEDRGVVGGLRRWSKCDIMWKRGEATG